VKRISTVGSCALVVLALCAVGVASASAASPEYRVCIKASGGTGEYSDKRCTAKAAGGKWKLGIWSEAKKKVYKSKSTVSRPFIQHVNLSNPKESLKMECAKERGEGELTGPKESKFTNSYSNCALAGEACETPGAGRGHVKTEPLTTTLVPLSGGRVGQEFAPTSGEVLARYNCGAFEFTDEGAEIGLIGGFSGGASNRWGVGLYGPRKLQEFLYIGGEGNETEEEEAIDSIEFEGCERKLEQEGKTHAEAKATCESTVGDGKEPAKPITGLSIIRRSGTVSVGEPFYQFSGMTNKGESLTIV
jgi:hypothetical protein